VSAKLNSERIETDFVIIGSGVAGLRAAADLGQVGRVLILTKTELMESNSRYAQGGIAAAMGESDSVELHVADTLAAGAGLCDEEAVSILAEEGPSDVQMLIDWGTEFDRIGRNLAFGREGAHSRPRVLHAQGDATGKEIVRALSARVTQLDSVRVLPFAFVQHLLKCEGRVTGVRFRHQNRIYDCTSSATLVASGGGGQVFAETTNPPVATGDSFALGYRAGAILRDMEFIQFHPTALGLPGLPRFLISEAVRGEGAYLITESGERFVDELAPRDVVARAIYKQINGGSNVYLDLRHLRSDSVRAGFPQIYSFCLSHGFDITRQPLPVVPAAHYFMGGLYTDQMGRTSIQGLYAAGEAASTGVHGANRLASNSLLECVVFGKRAAAAMASDRRPSPKIVLEPPDPFDSFQDAESARALIRETAWRSAGIIRESTGLEQGLEALERLKSQSRPSTTVLESDVEVSNLLLVARLVLRSAIVRLESRGAHFRKDYPGRNDANFGGHSWVSDGQAVTIRKGRERLE
jgi:L-aspartate oxidase